MIVSTKMPGVWSRAQWAMVPIIALLENDIFATFDIVASVNEYFLGQPLLHH